MPPKKATKFDNKPAKASVDKTFGMKNKKGGAAQKAIKQIQAQAADAKSPDQKRKDAEKAQREKEKKAAEEARKETADLFKPVQVQKVPLGVDPKTVVCQFWRAGNCEKGKKCKFAHDLAVERKVEKKNLYQDARDGEEGGKEEDMANWDEEKLREVVMSKHGNPKTTTDKVCKYFVDAVENGKYGWRWECPNGGDKCMYQHKLPPGFILKTKEQRALEKAAADNDPTRNLTLEDFLEVERLKLGDNLTPVTEESFQKWKKERIDKKQAEEEAKALKEATGKRLFEQGGFERDSEEDSDDEDDPWNLEALRRETEAARAAKEEERINAQFAAEAENPGGMNGIEVN